jgi:hypothetical protein
MNWPRSHFAQHKGAIFAAVLIGVVLAIYVLFPMNMQKTTAGFGPDWECSPQPKGDPVCIKKIKP